MIWPILQMEEGAAAADSLQDQAGKLTQMVHTFRLTRDEPQMGGKAG